MGSIRRRFAHRPLRWLSALGALVFALGLGGGAVSDWSAFLMFAPRAQALALQEGQGPDRTVGWPFVYRGRHWSVLVDVPESTIAAARVLPTERVFMSGGALREAYMSTLVRTQADSPLVGEVARQLRAYRSQRRLDDDEYVELIARAVQAIPYGTPRRRVAPPPAFLADGRGVCTERSVLLAALLLHEGYDTAVWVFDTQAHVAVGIRASGRGFEDSGYELIETTRESYVGETGSDLAGRSATNRAPQLIRLGGSRRYTADLQAQFIVATLARTRSSGNRLAEYRRYAETAVLPWRGEYARRAEEHGQRTRLASWLESATDDRALVFSLLTRGAGR